MKQDVPLVRRFSTLEPYQEAYTLGRLLQFLYENSVQPELCLFSGDGGTGLLADREPDKGSGRPGRHSPYMGPGPGRGVRQDVISCWYPQAKQAEHLQEGRRVV